MKYAKLYCALFLLTLLSALLLYSAYSEVRLKTIDQLNNQQIILAKEAARGIEGFFDHYARLLNALSHVGSVVALDQHGKNLMEVFYQSHAEEIKSITRMDADGRIVHSLPALPGLVGTDLSGQEFIKRMMKTHRPIVSDVFMSARGFESVAFHVPIIENDAFRGSISVLIPFDQLAKRHLGGIKLAEDGYAWMISRQGVELYCPVPGHVRKNVYENCWQFPSILSMADEMVQGKEGITTYLFDRVRGETVESVEKHAVYLPVNLPDNYWSIVVATPESEVLGSLHGFRNRCFLLVGVMLLTGVLCSYYLGRAFMIVKEEAKRKNMEMALQKSETKYRQLVELAQEGIWVIDTGGNTTLVNPKMAEMLGYTAEEMTGRRFDSFMGDHGVDIFKAFMEHGNQDVKAEYHFEFLRKDCVRIHTRVAACPIMDGGNCIGALAVVADVTDQKLVEEQLRESEERWHFALEGAGDGVWDWNAQTNRVYFSPRWKAMLGFEDNEIGDVLDEWEKRVHPEDKEQAFIDIKNHFDGRTPVYINEHRVLCKDGTYKWVLDRGRVISRTPDGKPLRVIGTYSDISERKQAEMAVQESAWFQQQLIDALPVPVFYKDSEGRYLGCNKAFPAFLKLDDDKIIGNVVFDVAPRELADVYHEKDLELLRNPGVQIYESLVRDANGFIHNVVFHKAAFFKADGSVGGLIGAILDITEDKRAEEQLRASEERYRLIFNHAPLGIVHFDQMGVIRDLNDKLAEIIGAPKEKILGLNMLERIRDKAALQTIKDAIESGMGYYEGDYLSVSGNKTTPLRALGKGIKAEDGKFLGGVGIFEDITERKRAEEGLKDSEQQLRSIIQGYPIPAFVIGKDHQVIYWNKALEEISRIEADEVVGTSLHWRAFYSTQRPCMADLLVDEVTPETISVWYKGISSKPSFLEEAYEATDFFPGVGSEGKWLHFTAAAIRNSLGTLVGAIETVEDVTARKEAEEALISANRQLNDIIEFLPDATVVLDMDKKVIAWNRAMEDMTGVSKKEMIGKGDNACTVPFYGKRRPHLIDLLDVSDEELESKYLNITKKGGILYGETYVPCLHGGKGACVFATGAALFDAHGNRVGAIESIRDITEQKLAQEALRRSEEKYRELVENANSIILRMDNAGNVTFFNEFAQRFFGYSEGEILGKNVVGTIVPPVETTGRDLRLMIEDIAVNPDRYASNVNENMRRGGERVWVAWTNKPIHYENGKVVEVLCVGNDITERKQAEEELKESRQQLSDIINFLPDPTLVIDRESRIIAWNRAIEDVTGIKSVDMLGKGNYEYALPFYGERRPILIDLVLEPHLEIDRQYVSVDRKGTVISGEAYTPMPDRGEVCLLGKASALFDSKGNVVGAIESIRDITDSKSMEKAVAEAEAKYRSIFENALMGIFQTTPDGRFLSLNEALARNLGYDSPEEVLNTITDIPRQLYVNPERRSELLRLIVERGRAQEFEVEFYRKDKSIAWITLNIRAVHDANGKIIHLEGIAQDITDSKLLASQLNQAQKMEAIGTLAGGIAHDFNNILAPIIGYSELSLNAVPKNSRLYHNIEQILLSGVRAKDLVKQILTFSRKTDHECRPVQVSLLIKETLKLLRSSLPSTIEIRQDLEEDAIDTTVLADPIQIHQVLMNLCTNAAHAMRATGGVLLVTLKNVDIDTVAIRELPDLVAGSYLRLSVADTGHGIDEAVRQRIFEPYFTTKGPTEGTGLGLALIYGIVKNLSGGITVSSKLGEGATFDVYFPRIKAFQTSADDLSLPLPTGKGLLLVVDDEKSIVDLLKGMLVSLGYDVAARYNSFDALQAFRARPDSFDLVITDQTMPHMTGIDLAREIQKIRSNTPIILCTGFSDTVDENKTKHMGIKGFLMKPVALRDLAVTVNKILFQDQTII